jgi:hypothetical protein
MRTVESLEIETGGSSVIVDGILEKQLLPNISSQIAYFMR